MPIQINKQNRDSEYHNIHSLQPLECPFVCEDPYGCCCPIVEDICNKKQHKRVCWCGFPCKFWC